MTPGFLRLGGGGWAFHMFARSLVREERQPCAGTGAGETGEHLATLGLRWKMMRQGSRRMCPQRNRPGTNTRRPMTEQQGQLMLTQG